MNKSFSIFNLLIFSVIALKGQNVDVIIKKLRTEKGQIAIGIFKDDVTFQKEEAFLNLRFPKNSITDGEMKVQFTLEPGIYGLSLLDDENSNGKMEYNFIGMPKEGFGFSDYYLTGFSKPKFDAFKFTLLPGEKKSITVRIRYIL